MPTETGSPWPSGPVFVSTPGTLTRFGWPFSGDNGAANVSSSSIAKNPQAASVAYRAPAVCPLLSTNRSRSAQSGFSGSIRSTPKNSVVRMSRTDRSPPTWPRPARPIIRRSVARDRLARSRNNSRRRSGPASAISCRSRRQAAALRGSATSMGVPFRVSGYRSGARDREVRDRLRVVRVHQHTVDRLLLRLIGLAVLEVGVGLVDGHLRDLAGRLEHGRLDAVLEDRRDHIRAAVEAD